jgi:virulence-associated protein VapD
MYAIIFDLDTEILKQVYPTPSYTNAYADVRNYLTTRGFQWVQGSGYFGDDTIDAVKCMRTVEKLGRKYPWFTAAVRDVRMLRIEENNDLLPVLRDDDQD